MNLEVLGTNFQSSLDQSSGHQVHLGVLGMSPGAPYISVDQFGNNDIFFRNTFGSPANHIY